MVEILEKSIKEWGLAFKPGEAHAMSGYANDERAESITLQSYGNDPPTWPATNPNLYIKESTSVVAGMPVGSPIREVLRAMGHTLDVDANDTHVWEFKGVREQEIEILNTQTTPGTDGANDPAAEPQRDPSCGSSDPGAGSTVHRKRTF